MKLSTILVALAGIACLLVAIGVGIVLPNYLSKETQSVEALTPLTLAELEQQQPGTSVLVEGRVSLDSPTHYNTFVAYWREKRRATTGSKSSSGSEWETDVIYAPPITIELEQGRVRVANEGYNLGTVTGWEDVDTEDGPRRVAGLRIGDPVVAIATLRSNSDGVRLDASVVTKGTKESYLADQRTNWWLSVGLGIASAFLGCITLWVARMLHAPPESAAKTNAGGFHSPRRRRVKGERRKSAA